LHSGQAKVVGLMAMYSGSSDINGGLPPQE
jgi:hypothetical protein